MQTTQNEKELASGQSLSNDGLGDILNFDAAISRIAAQLTDSACGGVDTQNEINSETGTPYGPGGHTGWLLAEEAKKLKQRHACGVRGIVKPGAMCGSVIVGEVPPG